MRLRCWLLSLMILGLGIVSAASAQQGVRWHPNLDAAKQLAAQTNRLVLIHFWSDACPPCERMERDVFPRPDVAAALDAGYVPVKIHVKHFPQTAREFGINQWPTDVVITPEGQVVDKSVGAAPAAEYIGRMNRVATNVQGQRMRMVAQIPSRPEAGPPTARPSEVARRAPGVDPFAQRSYQSAAPSAPVASRQPAAAQQFDAPPVDTSRGYSVPPWERPMASDSAIAGRALQPADRYAQSYRTEPMAAAQSPAENLLPQSPPPHLAPRTDLPIEQPSAQLSDARSAQSSVEPQADAAKAASMSPALGLEGFCPVQLAENNRWVRGNRLYGVIHRGRTYLFYGAEERDRFFADPDHYAPMIAGNDVVLAVEQGQMVTGQRDIGARYEGRIYLFANEASFERFDRNPERYAAAAAAILDAARQAKSTSETAWTPEARMGGAAPQSSAEGNARRSNWDAAPRY